MEHNIYTLIDLCFDVVDEYKKEHGMSGRLFNLVIASNETTRDDVVRAMSDIFDHAMADHGEIVNDNDMRDGEVRVVSATEMVTL